MRATATLLVTLATAIAAIGLAVAAPGGGHDQAQARVAAASGAAQIANSRAGQAVLSAGGMRPGGSATGTVKIGNAGSARGRFSVAGIGLQETPGAHGGLPSGRVLLVVLDVTDPDDHAEVYSGTPQGLAADLGTFAPGEERDYEVRITLPDGGTPGSGTTGDNRYQGAALSLGLEWRAVVAAEASTPTPAPKAPTAPRAPVTPTPTPTPTPTTPVSLPDALGLPAAKTCVKRGRLKLRLKGPGGQKVVKATLKVNGRVKARLKGAKARKPLSLRKLKRKTKLSISIKASDKRTYSASRSYKACKR
jgi:hypothetical protein